MTLPLRRKHRTTVRGQSIPIRTAASLLLAACWLSASASQADELPPVPQSHRQSSRGEQLPPPPPLPASVGTLARPTPLPAMPKTQPIQPTAFQPPRPGLQPAPLEGTQAYKIKLDPPGPEELFRLETEADLFRRIRQEAREQKATDRVVFPDEPILSKDPYYGRSWPEQRMCVEPSYVCHRRLFFEDKNAERYGWDFGILQPLVSTALFYKDTLLFPHNLFSHPCQAYECSAGQCLPGDPVPYLLYPPEFTVTGTLAEAAVIGLMIAIFP